MFKESFKGVSRKFKGCFKEDKGVFLETFKGDSWVLQGYLKDVSRKFQGGFKYILSVSKESVKWVSRKFQKVVSRIFQWTFVLWFCCCIDLIAATRAKEGLVSFPEQCLGYKVSENI